MSKSSKNRERRERVEQLRREAKAAERRRSLTIVAVCAVVAVLIVGVAVVSIVRKNQETDKIASQNLADIGASAEAAGCTAIKEEDATGAGEHTTEKVTYDTTPPSYGPHNPTPDSSGKHIYTDDRPDVEVLVHNLEHGWTIVWYDDSVADDPDQMKVLEATAKKLDAEGSDPAANVIIAPWTKDDQGGGVIPDGKHIAITHWSIHQPTYDPKVFETAEKEIPSFGVSQYCSSFSGAALDDFMKKYPYDDAPEGLLWHQQ
jgi:hypothetical protein